MSSSSSSGRVVITQVARSRRRSNRLSQQNVPSLQEFVHKQKVIHQYRHFFQCLKRIPDDDQQQYARVEVKQRFRQPYPDKVSIQMAIKEGERKLVQLQSMVGYTPLSKDGDSWLNIKDQEDPRGRVGAEWPWSRK